MAPGGLQLGCDQAPAPCGAVAALAAVAFEAVEGVGGFQNLPLLMVEPFTTWVPPYLMAGKLQLTWRMAMKTLRKWAQGSHQSNPARRSGLLGTCFLLSLKF